MTDKKIDPFTIDEDEFTSDETKERNEIMKQAALLIQAHNDLMNEIGIDNLIEKVSTLVDESESFKFRSDNARYIDEQVPAFIMALKDEPYKELEGLDGNTYENKVINLAQEEIIKPTGEMMEEYMNEYGGIFDDFEKESGMDRTSLIMSNIFGILIGQYIDNNIQLRIII